MLTQRHCKRRDRKESTTSDGSGPVRYDKTDGLVQRFPMNRLVHLFFWINSLSTIFSSNPISHSLLHLQSKLLSGQLLLFGQLRLPGQLLLSGQFRFSGQLLLSGQFLLFGKLILFSQLLSVKFLSGLPHCSVVLSSCNDGFK